MVYLTGDKHGKFKTLINWARENNLTMDDTIIVLGDAGLNYYLNHRDNEQKNLITKKLPCNLFVVRGNHEYRPEDVFNVPYYDLFLDMTLVQKAHTEVFFEGEVLVEDNHPKIKYAKDGGLYTIEGQKCLVIGGGYSVDKWYRLQEGWTWVENEQLDENELAAIYETYLNNDIDILLTHVAPAAWEPYIKHLFMEGLNQDLIDKTMENWMNKLYWGEKGDNIKLHYFGHFHASLNVGPVGVMLGEDTVVPFGEKVPS